MDDGRIVTGECLPEDWENNTFILLSYFIKQTQKTPFKEIEKARNMLADYLYRSDQNGK